MTQIRAKILDTMSQTHRVRFRLPTFRRNRPPTPCIRQNGPMSPILYIHQHQPTPGIQPLHRPAVTRSGRLQQWPSAACRVFRWIFFETTRGVSSIKDQDEISKNWRLVFGICIFHDFPCFQYIYGSYSLRLRFHHARHLVTSLGCRLLWDFSGSEDSDGQVPVS